MLTVEKLSGVLESSESLGAQVAQVAQVAEADCHSHGLKLLMPGLGTNNRTGPDWTGPAGCNGTGSLFWLLPSEMSVSFAYRFFPGVVSSSLSSFELSLFKPASVGFFGRGEVTPCSSPQAILGVHVKKINYFVLD